MLRFILPWLSHPIPGSMRVPCSPDQTSRLENLTCVFWYEFRCSHVRSHYCSSLCSWALVMLLAMCIQQWVTRHSPWPPAYLNKACYHQATSAAWASLWVPRALQATPGSRNFEVFWTLIRRWKMSASSPGRSIGHKEEEACGLVTWRHTLKTQVVLLSSWTRTCHCGRRCLCVSRALGNASGFLAS